jgi:hypothetical protein
MLSGHPQKSIRLRCWQWLEPVAASLQRYTSESPKRAQKDASGDAANANGRVLKPVALKRQQKAQRTQKQ